MSKRLRALFVWVILPFTIAPEIQAQQLGLKPLSKTQAIVKRMFDLVGAASLLILFAPVMAVVSVLIMLDSRGGVFFLQERTGENGKTFRVVKFRTMMKHNTPKEQLDFVTSADPRITPIGRILRNTSLDELPQLFNVLKGEMSLVGPRPQPVCHLEHYGTTIPYYALRHMVKPGITGLVQISDMRSQVHTLQDMMQRVQMDLKYIRTWSLWQDIAICLKTAATMLLRYNTHVKEYPLGAPGSR